jgi:sarcosine oxidase
VERQVQLWFEPLAPEAFAPGRFPVFLHFAADGAFYGLPPSGIPAVKLCRHHGGEPADPQTVDRALRPTDEEPVRAWARRHLPDAAGRLVDAQVCLYTNTPDGNFLIGSIPGEPRIFVAGGFSGHGFKLAPVVGEILADLVTRGSTPHDIRLFDPARFG